MSPTLRLLWKLSSLCCRDCHLPACSWVCFSGLPLLRLPRKLSSLCCWDPNCCLPAYNWVCFISLSPFALLWRLSHLLQIELAAVASLPSLKLLCRHYSLLSLCCCLLACSLPLNVLMLVLLWWNFAASFSFCDSVLSLAFSKHFLFGLGNNLLGTLSLKS